MLTPQGQLGGGDTFGFLCGFHSYCIEVTSLLLGDGKRLYSLWPPLPSFPGERCGGWKPGLSFLVSADNTGWGWRRSYCLRRWKSQVSTRLFDTTQKGGSIHSLWRWHAIYVSLMWAGVELLLSKGFVLLVCLFLVLWLQLGFFSLHLFPCRWLPQLHVWDLWDKKSSQGIHHCIVLRSWDL